MVKEIQARTILNAVKQPDTWFGLRYNMNLYRGCQHQCIYCDSRSECYQIEDFSEILVKINALELLKKELARKRIKGVIGFGSMNDPYMPVEAIHNMTGRALEIIAQYRFPVHILTKSDLVLRDIPVLQQIAKIYAAVTLTITTADDRLAKSLEPGAPPPSRRFQAIQTLAANGILTGVAMMPILPFLEDSDENITAIVERAHACGAKYILPAFGMTCRDRQREYFYNKLDQHFPGMRQKYEQRFGNRYGCDSSRAARLDQLFRQLTDRFGIARRMPVYQFDRHTQLSLF
ncbi:MAG: radical SAM protein [Anaerolineales bacterium]|nr:radical SAM protein [Anaerolineales bacterium]